MKTVIEMAREAGAMFDHMTWVERDLAPVFERFAALVREDERKKQQEPVAYMHTLEGDVQINNLPAECYGDHWKREPLYTTPPTAALAARQMRDAAVKVCEDCVDSPNPFIAATATLLRDDIAALPVPEVQWPDIEAAVLAEREACAKVCEHNKHRQSSHDDEYATGYQDASLDCANSIKKLGEAR